MQCMYLIAWIVPVLQCRYLVIVVEQVQLFSLCCWLPMVGLPTL